MTDVHYHIQLFSIEMGSCKGGLEREDFFKYNFLPLSLDLLKIFSAGRAWSVGVIESLPRCPQWRPSVTIRADHQQDCPFSVAKRNFLILP
jgi:hypothetical protein